MPMFQFPTLTKTGSMVVNLVNRLPMVSTPNTLNATPNATPNTDPNITPNITPNIGPNINPNTTPNINPPNATPNATPNQISIAQPVTSYSIYMDNYFTSVPIFKELRQQGYGVCGTTRSNQVPAVLGELREHSNSIPWNTLHAIEKENVLCLAWQDNNMVLALTTIHSLDAVIERTRKCPGELSTNANIVRKVFEGQPQKKLKIPLIIDDYNHNMNGAVSMSLGGREGVEGSMTTQPVQYTHVERSQRACDDIERVGGLKLYEKQLENWKIQMYPYVLVKS
ncbi:predicted protein [Histoplasma mississippiense (nom. inval.)]|uniref:predicted protein n=1 Tax=Ajellomyces capsulatus (strain NAm1 / WU24) TaxID=2059318 RepID=UPI000157C945|nr:predicted protein [Histoplasma mississippiense (nom. inval.)]EDN09660.1 predicted protein [Histoplasma mississippiense (nom. inval.)]